MIAFYRSACIAPGKGGSAMTFAREIAAYIKDKHGTDVQVGIPIGGNPNRVGWSVRYDSLAALETIQTKMLADQKYLDMVARGADNFIAGSVHDEIWRML
jgi:hypothetical protein